MIGSGDRDSKLAGMHVSDALLALVKGQTSESLRRPQAAHDTNWAVGVALQDAVNLAAEVQSPL